MGKAACLSVGLVFLCLSLCRTGFGADYPLHQPKISDVRLTDGFWQPRLELDNNVTLPHNLDMCRREGKIKKFDIASGVLDEPYPASYVHSDSDLFKVIEAAGHLLKSFPSGALETQIDNIVAKIAAAQEEDGYLFTARAICEQGKVDDPTTIAICGTKRYENLCRLSHELYNIGHMYEAAAAYYEATGKRNFLDVAIKSADHVVRTFNEDGIREPSGHQEIELGLLALYRATGRKEYLEQAKFFLDMRGHYYDGRAEMGVYGQDHKPVVEQDTAVGHVVRGAYMYSSMVDVSAYTGERAYAQAAAKIFEDAITRRMYVTGGFGVPHMEGYPEKAYDLPNYEAYCESCAAIASIFWADRMFRYFEDGRYYDILERTLYNAFLSSISLSGDHFNYTNPLESRANYYRAPWHGCACCPTNIVRMMAQIPQYIYSTGDDSVYVNLFVGSKATLSVNEESIEIVQQTDYPWSGHVSITVNPPDARPFAVYLRIPGWAVNKPVPSDLYRFADDYEPEPVVKLNGRAIDTPPQKGYVKLTRTWQAGDTIELDLPMPVRLVKAHENIEYDRGKVALQRGPIVYCAEGVDNNGHVLNTLLKDNAVFSTKSSPALGGAVLLETEAARVVADTETPQRLTFIPYYAWGNRGLSEMAVYIANTNEAVQESPPAFGYDFVPLPNRDNWNITTSFDRPSEEIHHMLDGNRDTVFSSGILQEPGQFVSIELPEKTSVDIMYIDAGQHAHDLPQGYLVTASEDGETWTSVAAGKGTSAVTTIPFENSVAARFFRIELTENRNAWWTFAELHLCQWIEEAPHNGVDRKVGF